MKMSDLLFTTLLIVAILCGYLALTHLLSGLRYMFYPPELFDRASRLAVSELLSSVILAVVCILLVRNGRKIAVRFLSAKKVEGDAEPLAEPNDYLEPRLDRHNLLFVFFIGLGVYTMIENAPFAINELIGQFKEKVGALGLSSPPGRDYLLLDLLRVTLGALLVYAAPTLTNYIEKTIAVRVKVQPKTS